MSKVELLDASRSVVVVIDLQGKLMEMIHRPGLVVKATQRLMQLADIHAVPVVLTEQYPEGLGPTHPDVRSTYDALTVDRRFLTKTSFGCCGDAGFERALCEVRPGVTLAERQVVVAGIEAHVCVMQTVIELLRSGQEVHVCWECVSSRGEEYRRHALERMAQAGAWITNHESAAFEWARTKDHAGFRKMNRLLREGQLT
ncbi:MAG: isochorismatase family protein [Planctomycetota bacterium]